MRTKILSILFFLSALIFTFPQLRPDFISDLVAKATIMPFLIAIYIINSGKPGRAFQWLMFSALLFSWAGDVALEIDNNSELMFMIGLAFFLLAHVFYFAAFVSAPGTGYSSGKMLLLLVPVVLYGAGLLVFLYDDLGELKLPVVVYAVVIMAMLAGAISRIGKVSKSSFYLVLAGAILFVLSDSMLAVNKFSYAIPAASVLIMSTYVIGQFLIVTGFLRQSASRLV